MVHIKDTVANDGERFSIFLGLNKNMVAQLKKLSLDESDLELQKNTGDRKRFGEGNYEDWYKKSRTPFALIEQGTDTLAALVWFGPRPPTAGHTIAWRSYRPFRGRGLMKDFTKYVRDIYKERFPDVQLWAEIKEGNRGSEELATYLGILTIQRGLDT